jgi:hypothetical protein
MRGALAAVPLLLALLAGCADEAGPASSQGLFAPAAATDSWDDPQFRPHPAYGWPTPTHIPPHAPSWWQPITPASVPAGFTHLERVGHSGSDDPGDGSAVFGRLYVVPGYEFTELDQWNLIFDVSDPTQPRELARFHHDVSTRDVRIIPYPDGRLVAVFTSDNGLLPVYDITDPTQPVELATVDLPSGGHTIALVPGTPIVYNANTVSTLGIPFHEAFGGSSLVQTEIYDFTDPEEPVLVQVWKNGAGCHAISFAINVQGRHRGYCAGVDVGQIWDVEDPTHPVVLSTFALPYADRAPVAEPPMVFVGHTALVNEEGTVLAITDESGGGVSPPGCVAQADTGEGQTSAPVGATWFYDISDERDPKLQGWVSATLPLDNAGPHKFSPVSCTSHTAQLVPDPERDILAVSMYAAGVALIDFTDPARPFFLDQFIDGTQAMDVRYSNGYLFAANEDSVDVLRLA